MTNFIEKNKGYVGLENLGNTCFMNSCLQIMKEIEELNKIVAYKLINKELKENIDGVLCLEWYNLNNMMIENNGIIRPSRFLEVLQKYSKIKNNLLFTGYSQNDIQEFFILLTEAIHCSMSFKKKISIIGNAKNEKDILAIDCYKCLSENYEKEYSPCSEMFQGIHVNYIHGLISGDKSVKPELYSNLCLPIKYKDEFANNIYDCFDIYTKYELLNKENKWFNEKKNMKEDAAKYIRFWNFPNILFILLKRFSFNARSKMNNLIDFPIDNLDLTKYVNGYKPDSFKYELFGVCNHSGGLQGGHYTAFVRNKNNFWLHYNDSRISEIKDKKDLITAKAYCLFYRKKNN